jgi:hypothetical protein
MHAQLVILLPDWLPLTVFSFGRGCRWHGESVLTLSRLPWTGDRSATNVVAHEIAHPGQVRSLTNSTQPIVWPGFTAPMCLHSSLRVWHAPSNAFEL